MAIINSCEEEFTIASKIEGGSAPFDFSYAIPRIVEARGKAGYVLMIIHGGKEFYQLPTPRMKRAYYAFVDMGVDAVVNYHQHCYGGFEVYKGKPIFYGLGNFCFDFHNKKMNLGTRVIWFNYHLMKRLALSSYLIINAMLTLR